MAGLWSKYKPHKLLTELRHFLKDLSFCMMPPELPAEELKERVRAALPCLVAIEKLPEGSPKVIGFTPKNTETFESLVAHIAQQHFHEPPCSGRLAIYIRFVYAKANFADLDNIEKSILDGLQKSRVFENDRQIEVHLSFRDYKKATRLEGSLVKLYEVRDPSG